MSDYNIKYVETVTGISNTVRFRGVVEGEGPLITKIKGNEYWIGANRIDMGRIKSIQKL